MEDYKEKYEQLIKRIKHFHETVNPDWKRIIESHVPELKEESEDEKIRKELIEHIKTNRESGFILFQKISPDEVIAWLEKQGEIIDEYEDKLDRCACESFDKGYKAALEKQGEQNKINWKPSKELINALEHFVRSIIESGYASPYDDTTKILKSLLNDLYKLEKQGEQKPDKAEPKFHEGEWITNGIDIDKIIGIDLEDKNYLFENGRKSDISLVENNRHIWTIQDAKDGDVLAFDDTVVIFKNLYKNSTFHSYCYVEDGVFDIDDKYFPEWWECEGFQPATKKQRDLLFQKMKEAGYEWDTEKKELKNIEQNLI